MSDNNDKQQDTQSPSMTHDTSSLEQRSGPGATLKQARLERRLEILDIAQHLHLPEAAVEALENNQYHYFPSLVFVRGHLRSYSRFLNLSPDDVIAHFNQLGLDVAPVKSQPQKIYVKPAYMNDKFIRVVSYGVALIVILALALWWSHHTSQEQTLVSPNGDASMTLSSDTSSAAADTSTSSTASTSPTQEQLITPDAAASSPSTSVTMPVPTTVTPTTSNVVPQATQPTTSNVAPQVTQPAATNVAPQATQPSDSATATKTPVPPVTSATAIE